MPFATTNDGVRLHYEETGAGTAIVFVHEFAGDHRSWEPQLRHFSRRYRCVAYNARGYPPSDVPGISSAIPRRARATTSAACSMRSASSARTWSASPWVRSPRCTSA